MPDGVPDAAGVPDGDAVEPKVDAAPDAGVGVSEGAGVEPAGDVDGEGDVKGDVNAGVLSSSTDGNALDCGADVTPDAPGFSDVAPVSPDFALAA